MQYDSVGFDSWTEKISTKSSAAEELESVWRAQLVKSLVALV